MIAPASCKVWITAMAGLSRMSSAFGLRIPYVDGPLLARTFRQY